MADDLGNALGGVMSGAKDLAGDVFEGVKNVAGGVADIAGDGLHSLGGVLGDVIGKGGPTGQPMEGLPAATQHMFSQATPMLDNVVSGAGKAAEGIMSVGSMLPDGDIGLRDIFDPNSVSSAVKEATGGGIGGLLRDVGKYAVPGLALAQTIQSSNQDIPGADRMEARAADADGRATQLANAANAAFEGKLPGTQMRSFENQAERAKAAIRQRYAGMGMSGSTAEQQDLSAVDMQIQEDAFRTAQNLATTGFNASAQQSGISDELYKLIWEEEQKRGTQFSSSLNDFVKAVSGII